MAVIQLNPPGMLNTDEGYISSITMRNAGGSVTYTPDGNNQIGVTGNALGALAATRLVGGQGVGGNGNPGQQIRLVTG
jgi:hypothetical protein